MKVKCENCKKFHHIAKIDANLVCKECKDGAWDALQSARAEIHALKQRIHDLKRENDMLYRESIGGIVK